MQWCPLVSELWQQAGQGVQDWRCWAVGKIVVISCLSGDLWIWWMLGCLDVQDAVLCSVVSRSYSTAREEPHLHLCMHRQTNACVHFSSCSNDVFTTSLSHAPSVFKHTHTSCPCTCTQFYNTPFGSLLLQGGGFIGGFFGVLGFFKFCNRPLDGKTFLQVCSCLFHVWHTCLGTSCAILYICPLLLAMVDLSLFLFYPLCVRLEQFFIERKDF